MNSVNVFDVILNTCDEYSNLKKQKKLKSNEFTITHRYDARKECVNLP